MQAMQLTLVSVVLGGLLASCSGAGDAATPASRGRVVDSSAGTVALGLDAAVGYRASGAGAAAITGTVSVAAPSVDSVVPVRRDTALCGDSARVVEVATRDGALANVLVWVDGIASGKPLPDVRRHTLTIERCRIDPRILTAVTGSTINVFSGDPVTHDLRFYREGATDPVTYARLMDNGQVVPSELLAASPGIVEARCTMHPWVRGYIAVFEHPYFAVTDEQGAFRIDGLPAGTYGVKVWHESMSHPVEHRVVVGDGGVGRLDVRAKLGVERESERAERVRE